MSSPNVQLRITGTDESGSVLEGTRAGLERVAKEMQFLQTQFKLGRVTQQEYNTAIAETRVELEGMRGLSSLTSTELGKFNVLLKQTEESTTGAGAGLSRVRFGLLTMTDHMVGANRAVGSVASGLLMFGTGGTVTLGVIAGVLAIAGIYEGLSTKTRHLEEENAKLVESFEKQGDSALPKAAQAMKVMNAALDEQVRLTEKYNTLKTLGGAGSPFQAAADLFGFTDDAQNQANAAGGVAAKAGLKAQSDRIADRTRDATQRAEAIAAGVRSNELTQQTITLEANLRSIVDDTTKSWRDRAEAQKGLNALTEAQNKLAKDREEAAKKALIQQQDEIKAIGELAKLGPLSAANEQRLLDLYQQVTIALQNQNLRASERVKLLQQQIELTNQLRASTGQDSLGHNLGALTNVNASGASDAQGASLVNAANAGGLSLAMQGVGGEAGESPLKGKLDAQAAAAGKSLEESLKRSLADGLVKGFQGAMNASSVGAGLAQFGAAILSTMGSIMIKFGTQTAAFATAVKAIKASLFTNPEVSLGASIALIAIGEAFEKVGNSLFSSGGGGSSASGYVNSAVGGSASTNYNNVSQDATKATVVVPREMLHPTDPRALDYFQQMLQGLAGNRQVQVQFT